MRAHEGTARRYAKALFQIARETASMPTVGDDLARFLERFDGDAHLHDVLTRPWIKGVDRRGFIFFTNMQSPKAQSLLRDSRAALCFYWMPLDKQVRVRGRAEVVSEKKADAYFTTRPRLSQISAWASKQSKPMRGYFELEAEVAKAALRFGNPDPGQSTTARGGHEHHPFGPEHRGFPALQRGPRADRGGRWRGPRLGPDW